MKTLLLFILLGIVYVNADFGVGYIDENLSLSDNQDETVFLDCAKIRTGTFILGKDHSKRCSSNSFYVNFRIKYGQNCHGYQRFYLNIRKLKLNDGDKIVVYPSMRKSQFGHTLFGQHDFSDSLSIPSISQFYTSRDSLRLEYIPGGNCNPFTTEFVVDFTLVQIDNKQTDDERFCKALHGFIPHGILCANDSRITCPDSYRYSTDIRNPGSNLRTLKRCIDSRFPIGDIPDMPDLPDTPDTPDKPDTPDLPDKPDTPDTPDKPDTPDIHDKPEGSDVICSDPQHQRNPFIPDIFSPCRNPQHRHPHRVTRPPGWTLPPHNHDQDENEEDGWNFQDWQNIHSIDWDDNFNGDSHFRPHHRRTTRRPSSHHHRSRLQPWAVILISLVTVGIVFVLPIAVCCYCRRNNRQVAYQQFVSPSAPPSSYGTFDPNAKENVGVRYMAPSHAPLIMMSPPTYPYMGHEVKIQPPRDG